jgi:hypothetical protein
MILIKRRSDNEIMNARTSNDWGKTKNLQCQMDLLASLPLKTTKERTRIEDAISKLESDRANWYTRRIQAVIGQYGGILSD